MRAHAKVSCISFSLLFLAIGCAGQPKPTIDSLHARRDIKLTTDPASPFWRAAQPIYAEADKGGHVRPGYRTEIRTRWTGENIYFLFIGPYKVLYTKTVTY